MSLRRKVEALAEKWAATGVGDATYSGRIARSKCADELRAILAEGDVYEKEIADRDIVIYGSSFMVDGERIDPARVSIEYTTPPDTVPRAEYERVVAEVVQWSRAYAFVTDILPLDDRNLCRDPVCPQNMAEQDRHRVDALIQRAERAEAECKRMSETLLRIRLIAQEGITQPEGRKHD